MNLSAFCRLWERKGAWRWTVAVCAVLVLLLSWQAVRRALGGSSEFYGFRRIVQVSLVEGKNHYEVIPHLRAYPPFFAIFWAPFGMFPLGEGGSGGVVAHRIGLGVSAALAAAVMIAFTFWAVRAAVAAAWRGEKRPPFGAYVLVWFLSAGPAFGSIARLETDMLIVMAVAGAMWLMLRKKRCFWGGVLLGLAAAVKLTPGLFGVYLVCRRQWKALAGMVAAGVVCTVLLPALVWGPAGAVERHGSWLRKVIIPYARKGPEAFIGRPYRRANQSPRAALTRYLTHYNASASERPRYVNLADLSPETVRTIATVLKVLLICALIAVWVRAGPDGGPTDLPAFTLVPLGMLLLSDVSLTSHTAIFVIPYAALVGTVCASEGAGTARRLSWALSLAFLLSASSIVRLLRELSTTTCAMLVLFAAVMYAFCCARREAREGEGLPSNG